MYGIQGEALTLRDTDTQSMMTLTEQYLGQLPGDVLAQLRRTDQLWAAIRAGTLTPPKVVSENPQPLGHLDWDVVICGGTLGIVLGAMLAQQGWRVALLERGILQGRVQEWNISRRELQTFIHLGLLTEAELEEAIASEYNPGRIQFHQGPALWVTDVLNVGVDPVYLLATLKRKFLACGGVLVEQTPFEAAVVHPDGVHIQAGAGFTTRLAIDAMGHFSPIVQQARAGQKPDAICMVVGTCAAGFPQNDTGDLIVSFTPIRQQCQYFWEAFPARDGRTTYLFTYLDAAPQRFSLETLFEEYWALLPDYQAVDLQSLQIQRALFGVFPCYRNSPLRYPWPRMLAVGDSSGNQSPLSFGGFGAMVRHLERLSQGIQDALQQEALSSADLGWLQPYQPNLSVTWLFQRSMSVQLHQQLEENQINTMLSAIFQDMAALGDEVLKPFLQDVVKFSALAQTLLKTSVVHPRLVAKIIPHVGLINLLQWIPHYLTLAFYSGLYPIGQLGQPLAQSFSPKQHYRFHRWLDALRYGTGRDYLE